MVILACIVLYTFGFLHGYYGRKFVAEDVNFFGFVFVLLITYLATTQAAAYINSVVEGSVQ